MSAFFWKFSERVIVQVFQFGMMISFAAFVSPRMYGELILLMMIVHLASIFINGGMANSLVQNMQSGQRDFSTLFYVNVLLATVLYSAINLFKPLITPLFTTVHAHSLLTILATLLFIFSIQSIQQAYIMKHEQFKSLFICSTIACLLAMGTYITVLIYGHYEWAFVTWHVSLHLFLTMNLFIATRWLPAFTFSIKSLRRMFQYSWKITASIAVDQAFVNGQYALIGKFFSPALLALYNRGEQFPSLIVNNVNGTLQSILFPKLSKLQLEPTKMKEQIRTTVTLAMFVVPQLLCYLAILAEPLIAILFSEEWAQVATYIQLLCFAFVLWPVHAIFLTALNALGRTDLYLKVELFKKVLSLFAFLVAIQLGIFAYIVTLGIISIVAIFINGAPLAKILHYQCSEQCQDLFFPFISNVSLGAFFILAQYYFTSFLIYPLAICSSFVLYVYFSKRRSFDGYVQFTHMYQLATSKIRNRKHFWRKRFSNE